MSIFRRSQRDFEEEIKAHLEIEADQLIAEGNDPARARELARRAFGNVGRAQERYYDANAMSWLADARTDARYALRMLRKRPSFCASVIAISALGLIACVSTFSLVSGILFSPLPFSDSDRVFAVEMHGGGIETAALPIATYRALAADGAVKAIGAAEPARAILRFQGEATRVRAELATPSYFRTYDLTPALGRFFDDADVVERRDVAVVGHEEWLSRYRADSAVLGRTITINERPHVIIGVMPARFADQSFAPRAYWLPMRFEDNRADVNATLRLADGVPADQAAERLGKIIGRVEDFSRGDSVAARVAITPIADQIYGYVRRPLMILLAAVLVVLALVAANVATMFLAQLGARSGELVVRRALGAGRGRQIRQLLVESLTLNGIGGAIGLGVTVLLIGTVRRLGANVLPRIADVTLDWRVAIFAVGAILVTGCAGGLAQALASRRDPSLATAGTSARMTSPRASTTLVALQVMFSVVLLVGAGLLVKGFMITAVDRPGYAIANRAAILVDLNSRDIAGASARVAEISRRLQLVPGVTGVAATTFMPLTGNVSITDAALTRGARGAARRSLYQNSIDAGFFDLMEMTITRGRGIRPDDGAGSDPVAVISESAATALYGAENPIGRTLFVGRGPEQRPVTVVGVVNDSRLTGRTTRKQPQLFLPLAQGGSRLVTLAVAMRSRTEPALTALRRAIVEVAPNVIIEDADDMEEIASAAVSRARFFSVAMAIFAGAAIVLTALGVYGLLAFTVSQRTREIGIRKALGATSGRIGRAVVLRAASLGVAGSIAGLAIAFAVSRFMESLLQEVSARDPMVFAVAAVVTLTMALLAALLPTVAAARVDPAISIRN